MRCVVMFEAISVGKLADLPPRCNSQKVSGGEGIIYFLRGEEENRELLASIQLAGTVRFNWQEWKCSVQLKALDFAHGTQREREY